MEEAIKFIQDFIRMEYAAYQASYLERDTNVFRMAQRPVKQMFSGIIKNIASRDMEPDEVWFAEGPKNLSKIRERLLYQIKEYEHPEYGSLWGCYVSDTHGWLTIKDGIESPPCWSESFSSILYVANITNILTGEKNLSIIAEYNCTNKSYQYGSLIIEPLGKPLAIVQFQPPKDEESKEEYEKDSELVKQLLTSQQ